MLVVGTSARPVRAVQSGYASANGPRTDSASNVTVGVAGSQKRLGGERSANRFGAHRCECRWSSFLRARCEWCERATRARLLRTDKSSHVTVGVAGLQKRLGRDCCDRLGAHQCRMLEVGAFARLVRAVQSCTLVSVCVRAPRTNLNGGTFPMKRQDTHWDCCKKRIVFLLISFMGFVILLLLTRSSTGRRAREPYSYLLHVKNIIKCKTISINIRVYKIYSCI